MNEEMEASTSKEYADFAKSLEDELLNYTSNFEETNVDTYLAERTGNTSSGKEGINVTDHSDSTECSSSFAGSDCGDEGADASEVLSDFCGGAGSENLFQRRKKLSSNWRSFIHPLMWRCKWVELQIKKLEGQARKYDRKLEEYSQKNLVKSESSSMGGHGVRQHPFSQSSSRSDMLRRKKRRRAEETSDIAAYMSRHSLFSYYEHRRYIREISHNVLKNPDTCKREEVRTDVELENDVGEDCDKFLEDILRKIDVLESRVRNLKSRSEKVMAEERVKLRLSDCLSSSPSLSSPPPTLSYQMPVGNYIASQLLAAYNMGAVLLPSKDEAAAPHANGAIHHPHFAYDYENEEEEDVLIDNQWVREELPYFEEVKFLSTRRPPPPPPQIHSTEASVKFHSTKRPPPPPPQIRSTDASIPKRRRPS